MHQLSKKLSVNNLIVYRKFEARCCVMEEKFLGSNDVIEEYLTEVRIRSYASIT